ncbi:DUF6624 domain-containing protein [Aquimarina sp. W85]|uniref:DUF6624 domain-containing protein n=1 Tax=Aquimarina rhodophyticola TaxID=3342246 RepID=UPI00366AC5BB
MNSFEKLKLIFMLLVLSLATVRSQETNELDLNNDSVTSLMEKAVDKDQSLRNSLRDVMKQPDFQKTPEFIKLITEIKQNDIENQKLVSTVIKNYGWPEVEKTSIKTVEAMFYFIQHSNVTFMEEHLDDIKLSAEKGDLSKDKLAMLEDRILLLNNKPQRYGTQPKPITGKQITKEIWPIEDFKNIDQRRKSMGLEPFEKFLKSNGYSYQENQ